MDGLRFLLRLFGCVGNSYLALGFGLAWLALCCWLGSDELWGPAEGGERNDGRNDVGAWYRNNVILNACPW